MDGQHFSGWLWELDIRRREALQATSADLSEMLLCAAETEPPAEIDPRLWHRQERQARNDCQGHAQSSVCEAAFVLATGAVIQMSPHFSYVTSQLIDGINSDSGSTISGGLEAARRYGLCPLDVCPYPSNYNPNLTQAMYAAAEAYKIGAHSVMRNYDDVFAWLSTGQGGINIGCGWGWQGSGNVMESWRFASAMHATALLGYSPRTDRQGRHYIWEANSGYPSPGFRELSPEGLERCLAHQYTVAIGMSHLTVPKLAPIAYNPLGI